MKLIDPFVGLDTRVQGFTKYVCPFWVLQFVHITIYCLLKDESLSWQDFAKSQDSAIDQLPKFFHLSSGHSVFGGLGWKDFGSTADE